MPHIKDITGQKYNNLTVIEFSHTNEQKKAVWKCLCECGNTVFKEGTELRKNKIKSCGCRQHIKELKTHGDSRTRLYQCWKGMKSRVNNNIRYINKNIKLHPDWQSFVSFKTWALNNGYIDDLTLDRIDYNGNYEPSNCRWVDYYIQENNRSNSIKLTINKDTKSLTEWCRIYKLKYDTVWSRLYRQNYTIEEAFELLPRKKTK